MGILEFLMGLFVFLLIFFVVAFVGFFLLLIFMQSGSSENG